jgi:hypothetical protein
MRGSNNPGFQWSACFGERGAGWLVFPLKEAVAKFVEYYNNKRYHESLNNLTPVDVYFGRGDRILKERQKIKERTIRERRNLYIKSNLKSIHA